MRFVRRPARHVWPGRSLVVILLAVGGLTVLGGGRALADGPVVPSAPLAGSASASLTQVNAGEWTTTVYLDTAALCAGDAAAGNTFTLVTGKPSTVTAAARPTYPDGPLACAAAAASPVTEVKLSFAPSPPLSAVPQTATLSVTPPQALLQQGDPPVQIPLSVRRTVSPWQYVGIPAICGGALAALLVLLLIAIGVPGRGNAETAVPARSELASVHHESASAPAQPAPALPGSASGPSGADFNQLVLLFLMAKRHEVLVTDWPVFSERAPAVPRYATDAARAGRGAGMPGQRPTASGTGASPGTEARSETGAQAGTSVKSGVEAPADAAPPWAGQANRVHWGLAFWRTPLFAGAAWSFGDSWATSVTPLTALAGGVLTASGAVSGLVPGVDLTRFGLLMALVGGLATFAPLVFSALNSLFAPKGVAEPVPVGEVIAARLWVMLLASCLTVFAIGAEIGFVGLVLGFNLIVVSPSIRWLGPAAAGLAALLFLAYGAHSLLTLAGTPMGTPKRTAHKSSFMI
ncbi:MAG TPA: hypothetical protein VIZ43_13390 [Trebonia sp.]